MSTCIYIFLLISLAFCYLERIRITDKIYTTLSPNVFYTKTKSGSIHIFYGFSLMHQFVYDENEEFVSESNVTNNLKKIEYFDYNNNEYLKILQYNSWGDCNLYYVNEETNKGNYFFNVFDFVILKNNDFIIIRKVVLTGIVFSYCSYPPINKIDLDKVIFFSSNDTSFDQYDQYGIVETSKALLFLLLIKKKDKIDENELNLYELDKNEFKLNKIETLQYNIESFSVINLDNDSDNFIYCFSTSKNGTFCVIVEYNHKEVIFGNTIKICSWQCELKNVYKNNYILLENQEIAIICPTSSGIRLTTLKYNDNIIRLSDYFSQLIITISSDNIKNIFFINNLNKGPILYYTLYYASNREVALYKSYINKSCSSFRISIHPFVKANIKFSEYITGGINDYFSPTFMITKIDSRISLFVDGDTSVKEGNTVYNNYNSFSFIASNSEYPLIINFQNIYCNYSCSAIISIIPYEIKIKDKSYICIKRQNRLLVNNITNHDLNKTFYINNYKSPFFFVEFDYEPEKEDLVFKFSNINFLCHLLNRTTIKCQMPIDSSLLPRNLLKFDYNIYASLSCLNKIYIGTITLRDHQIYEVIEAENLVQISQKIDKSYDASQKIEKFSVDMISYYYWFSSFGYCNDYLIKEKKCCEDQLLTDWEIIFHKEYSFYIQDFLNLLNIKNDFNQIKQKIFKASNIDGKKYNFKIYFYNVAILKSSKFKKYIFTFPGFKAFYQVLPTFILNHLVDFEKDKNIKVNKYFYLIFEIIKNDIFSEVILNDIKQNKDYQIIFTGHSLGGAIATLASYYFKKYNLGENEPILITFGQPRVGNENFAINYMEIISSVYRIERENDIVSMFPPIKNIKESDTIHLLNFLRHLSDLKSNFQNLITCVNLMEDAIIINGEFLVMCVGMVVDYIKDLLFESLLEALSKIIPYGYCHIGGLYVINKDSNRFYHCKDIFNEDVDSPYCKNQDAFGRILAINLLKNNNYLTDSINPIKGCQEHNIPLQMVFA